MDVYELKCITNSKADFYCFIELIFPTDMDDAGYYHPNFHFVYIYINIYIYKLIYIYIYVYVLYIYYSYVFQHMFNINGNLYSTKFLIVCLTTINHIWEQLKVMVNTCEKRSMTVTF